MIGAMLVWGLAPLGDDLISATAALVQIVGSGQSADTLGVIHVFALSAAALLGMHLVFTLMLTFVRIERQRHRHRDMLNLLSFPVDGNPSTRVINHPSPVAYCLPGGARSVTVLSDGLLQLLTRSELEAVLIHERAHLNQRHHLLLWAFAAWRSAIPWLPTSQLAHRAVNELIEMLADDEALKSVDETTLMRAIAVVAAGTGPQGATDPRGGSSALGPSQPEAIQEYPLATAQRVQRLLTPQPALSLAQQGGVLSASALLLAIPPLLLLMPLR